MAGMGQSGRDAAGASDTILSYSPYDNVAPQALSGDPRARRPHRSARDLLGAGEMGRAPARHHDRAAARSCCKINMEAGHGGAAGRFDRLEEVGLIYAFAIRAIEGFEDMEARSAA